MQYSFDTTGPLVADIAIRSGQVDVVNGADEHAEVTVVGHDGEERDDLEVSFDGRLLLVREPEGILAFWGPSRPVTVTVSIPSASEVRVNTGSATVDVTGTFAQMALDSASGAVTLDRIDAASRVRTGSGRIRVRRVDAELALATGSGDVSISEVHAAVRIKAGSGATTIGAAYADVAMSAGSGDVLIKVLHEGELRVRTGSGNVSIGVRSRVPVWTDVSAHGGIANQLTPRGRPAEGEPCVRVRGVLGSGRLELADA